MMTARQFFEAVTTLGFQVLEWEEDLFKKYKKCRVDLRKPQVRLVGDSWEDVLSILNGTSKPWATVPPSKDEPVAYCPFCGMATMCRNEQGLYYCKAKCKESADAMARYQANEKKMTEKYIFNLSIGTPWPAGWKTSFPLSVGPEVTVTMTADDNVPIPEIHEVAK